jgi:hypothetical protein
MYNDPTGCEWNWLQSVGVAMVVIGAILAVIGAICSVVPGGQTAAAICCSIGGSMIANGAGLIGGGSTISVEVTVPIGGNSSANTNNTKGSGGTNSRENSTKSSDDSSNEDNNESSMFNLAKNVVSNPLGKSSFELEFGFNNFTPDDNEYDESLNNIWNGSQYELSNVSRGKNKLCLAASMLFDCVRKQGNGITLRTARGVINVLENEGLLYSDNKGNFGYLNSSQTVQNRMWRLLGNDTGTWTHRMDSNLNNMTGNNKSGYVNANKMYNGQMHWVSVNSITHGIFNSISSISVFDSVSAGLRNIQSSDISNISGHRIRSFYNP